MIVTTQDYGQFLINGVNNYAGTYFSKIVEGLEHDSVWRHLNGSKLPSKVIWERVSEDIIYSLNGYLFFDDSVLDKNSSKKIKLARWQYSGTEHDTVMGGKSCELRVLQSRDKSILSDRYKNISSR